MTQTYRDKRYICNQLSEFIWYNNEFVIDTPDGPVCIFTSEKGSPTYSLLFCPFCGKKIEARWEPKANQMIWQEVD